MVSDIFLFRVSAKFFVPFQGFVREVLYIPWSLQLLSFGIIFVFGLPIFALRIFAFAFALLIFAFVFGVFAI